MAYPDGIHAEFFQVIQFGVDPIQVADAITIAVGKAARINLIENGMLPPVRRRRLTVFALDGVALDCARLDARGLRAGLRRQRLKEPKPRNSTRDSRASYPSVTAP